MNLYIGLISGTSMDGVDAALVSFDEDEIAIVGGLTLTYPEHLRMELARAIRPESRMSLHEFASLDIAIGRWFARTANELLEKTSTSHADVIALGSHGQTLRHSPDTDPPYSIQIGDPATIAVACSITTVADFRALDIAAGGQGAPLVPAFHEARFRHHKENTVVLNIGGIANITVLPSDPRDAIQGFDTGPGNCLLDEWIRLQRREPYDDGGRWAASGNISKGLLDALMADEYIQRPPAKSTGREYFNLTFLTKVLTKNGLTDLAAEDVQATLASYTVTSITHGIEQSGVSPDCVLVCGGGAKNEMLMQGLRASLPRASVESTAAEHIDPDLIEALAFAWLAKQRLEMKPVRLTTGSGPPRILGAVYERSV